MEAKCALQKLRPSRRTIELGVMDRLVNMLGGRLSYINKVYLKLLFSYDVDSSRQQVAKSRDMIFEAEHMLSVEKQWLLSQIGKWRQLLQQSQLHFNLL